MEITNLFCDACRCHIDEDSPYWNAFLSNATPEQQRIGEHTYHKDYCADCFNYMTTQISVRKIIQ